MNALPDPAGPDSPADDEAILAALSMEEASEDVAGIRRPPCQNKDPRLWEPATGLFRSIFP